MSVFSVLFLYKSVGECINSANANRLPPYSLIVCDLVPAAYLLFLVNLVKTYGLLGFKVARFGALGVATKEKAALLTERATLVAGLTSAAPASSAALASSSARRASIQMAAAAAQWRTNFVDASANEMPGSTQQPQLQPPLQPPLQPQPQPQPPQPQPNFVTVRSGPSSAAPALSNIAAAEEAAEAPTVRGRCDGCRRNVLSNDEGRQREGDKYYHSKCVKGFCGGCGLIVHIDAGRVKRDRVYWHADCANP